MSESARGEGGRVWVPRDPMDARKPKDIPEAERYYFLEERYPKYRKDWTDRAALDDVIQPEDVADAAWWLGAGAAKTTGEVLLVDAGTKVPPP